MIPSILNELSTDALYDPKVGFEPQRNVVVLQSWEAVRALNSRLIENEQPNSLAASRQLLAEAQAHYEEIPFALDSKSNAEHLVPLLEGFDLFEKLAEL